MTSDRSPETSERRLRIAYGLGSSVGAFLIATLAMSVFIYAAGGAQMAEQGREADAMGLFELTSAAAFEVATLVMSLVMGLIGLVTAAGAAIIGFAVAALGLAGGAVVGLGVISGPVLLMGAIAVVIKRRFFPDVI